MVQESNPGGGARFSAPIQTGPGAHPGYCEMDTGSFPGVKLSGRGFDHPHLSSVKVKERVQLYIFPSGPSWPVPGGTLPLPLPLTLPGIHLDTKVFCGMTLVSLGD